MPPFFAEKQVNVAGRYGGTHQPFRHASSEVVAKSDSSVTTSGILHAVAHSSLPDMLVPKRCDATPQYSAAGPERRRQRHQLLCVHRSGADLHALAERLPVAWRSGTDAAPAANRRHDR